ncbi:MULTISPECIES: phenylacetate--CoA ligase family protein [unclassified Brenneria]|uniref:phenylacetate--CoA ligase family protein n=1 Tax=unclassified Brenneria TaxID=2634434 RepID=UPI0018F0967D|nr:phenylacetate--CoA ligase family protein [Brenneria sp. L3-3C-1]MBJ7223905.1 phenylacetate--CoA ligase family protein [Brenneria sp. L3-3C-1]MEE3645150.1 phenylacetate--CoA ligase family protein [Brenneria sp. L3_3C_1]
MNSNQTHQKWLDHVTAYLNQHTTPQSLLQKRESHIQEVLEYVKDRSSFYREHLKRENKTQSILKILENVPFTTKGDLRSAGISVCSAPFDEIAMYYETTGTTGKPTPCPRAPIDADTSGAYVQYAMNKLYQSTFGTMKALTAIMGPSELYAFGDTYGEACRNLGIPFVRLWPESPRVGLDKAAQLIKDLGVRSLICSPAVALALARLYVSLGIEPRETAVKQILVLGELCTPEMLVNIGKIWGAQCTHGLYGSQEAHAVATGCPEGNLHLSETNYLAEILPIPELGSELGELCLTMLVPGAKPLIRFCTGDLVSLQPATHCSCGNHSRCLRVYGRADDVMAIGGRKVYPAAIESIILTSADWVWGYQVNVSRAKDGTDEIDVLMTANIGSRSVDEVQKLLADFFGVPVRLQLVERLDSRTETGAYISWKHARVQDNRKESTS